MRTQPKLQMSAALPCPSPFALVMTSGAMYAGDSYITGIMQNHVTNTMTNAQCHYLGNKMS